MLVPVRSRYPLIGDEAEDPAHDLPERVFGGARTYPPWSPSIAARLNLILSEPPYTTGEDFRYNVKCPADDGSRQSKWLRHPASG